MTESESGESGADGSAAVEQAYRMIREQILSGQREADDWLREGDLADAIGVSRTPVREALRRLTAEGLVRYERNRGVQVQAWTTQDLEEIFSLRSVLEPWGCRLAAGRATVDCDALGELARDMVRAASGAADVDRISDLNNRFHQMILEGSGNRRLQSVLATVVQVPLVWQTFSRYSKDDLRRSLAHHHEIVSALSAGDGDWAEAVMRSHIRAAWNSLRPVDS